jgi:hypothetical protein
LIYKRERRTKASFKPDLTRILTLIDFI